MIHWRIPASTGRHPSLALAALAVVFALVAAPTAMGTSPTTDQHGPRSQQIAAPGSGESSGGGSASSTTTRSTSDTTIGSLPFTGLDLGVLAVAGVALLGAGFALQRLSDPARRSPHY